MSPDIDNERSEAGDCHATTCSRIAFEEWFENDAFPLEHSNWFLRDEDGDYKLSSVLNAWEAWEASRLFHANAEFSHPRDED